MAAFILPRTGFGERGMHRTRMWATAAILSVGIAAGSAVPARHQAFLLRGRTSAGIYNATGIVSTVQAKLWRTRFSTDFITSTACWRTPHDRHGVFAEHSL